MRTSSRHATDSELLVAARTDPGAFGAVYRRHASGVHRFLRRQNLGPEQALDLTAEIFAVALESIDSYQPGAAPGSAWIYGIARNVMYESFRKGRVEESARLRLGLPVLYYDDDELDRLERAGYDVDPDALSEAVADLSAAQQGAIHARFVEEQTYTEIAAALKCSEQVARKHVSRGLARLRFQILGGGS